MKHLDMTVLLHLFIAPGSADGPANALAVRSISH
jgi:hypothetical protein